MCLRALGAPQRNLQRIDGFVDPSVAKMDAAEEQVGLGFVWRQVQRAIQLQHRLAIVFLVEEAAPAIQIESRELALIPLPGRCQRRRHLAGVRQLDVALHAFEAPRHCLGRRPFLPLLVGGRQPPSELFLPCSFGDIAGRRQGGAEDEVRVAVGWIAADRFTKPIDGRLRITSNPVRVPKIEEVVGIVRIELGSLVEIVRGLTGLRRRCAASKLHNADVVQHCCGRPRVSQHFESGKRLLVAFQIELSERGEKPGATRQRRLGRDVPHGVERALVIALFLIYVPQGEAGAVECRLTVQRGREISDRGRRRIGEQAFDVILEHRQRGVQTLHFVGRFR